jgi:hypothetical protein
MSPRLLATRLVEGPPKWAFTVYGLAIATIHLALAVVDYGRAFELWEAAWPFYSILLGTTSATSAWIHTRRRGRAPQAPQLVDAAGEELS